MTDENRGEDGTYTEKFSDEAFIEAIEEGNETTREIAESVECSYNLAYERLQTLDGVSSRKVGNTLLWRLDE